MTKTMQILATLPALLLAVACAQVSDNDSEQGVDDGDLDPEGSGAAMGETGGTGSGASDGVGGAAATGGLTGGGPTDSCNPADQCPAENGVEWECKRRFMLGANWAWRDFGTDFGGLEAWGRAGVSENSSAYSADMAQLKAGGSSVLRWWMFPRFLTDSIQWGSDDTPSGVGGTMVADIQAALELAEQNNVYLMLTLFSFDNFYYGKDEGSGVYSRSIIDMVTDPTRRAALVENLVRPVAQAVEASPYKHRMLAWDLINEPELAMTGNNPLGGEPFSPLSDLYPVTHAEMKTFLDAVAVVLRQESTALLTIGSAGIGWASAWTESDIDFYQVHYYDWIYHKYPYTDPAFAPDNMGLAGKPVVMGEYPYRGLTAGSGLPAKSLTEFLDDLWTYGYAGALGWSLSDTGLGGFDGPTQNSFANSHPCEATY